MFAKFVNFRILNQMVSLFYILFTVYVLMLPLFAPYIFSSLVLTVNFILLIVISGISDVVIGPFLRHPIKSMRFFFKIKKKHVDWDNFKSATQKNFKRFTYKSFKNGILNTYFSAFLAMFFFQPYAYIFSPYKAYLFAFEPSSIGLFGVIIELIAYFPFLIGFVVIPAQIKAIRILYENGYFLVFQIFLIDFLRSLSTILPLLLGVAFLTLYERKVLASVQLRRGPDVTGMFGLFQPIADGFKLLFKELIVPLSANKLVFILAPILTFFFAFFGVLMFPFYTFDVIFDFELSIILFFGLSSIGIFGIILSGWASNSRYAFLGSLRSTAQMISYEVSLGLTLQTVCLPVSSLAFSDIVMYQINHGWFIFPFFFSFVLFVISTLAEVNRPPFDLPEAEAELVSGYNVEYSSSTFALFFIGEYANIIVSSLVSVFFFFGGSGITDFAPLVLALKLLFFLTFFILIRAALPRFRYDQLITFGWKGILPISFGWFFFSVTLFYFLNVL